MQKQVMIERSGPTAMPPAGVVAETQERQAILDAINGMRVLHRDVEERQKRQSLRGSKGN